MNDKKGFTLIELLAVIVILAVIALIATPIIMNVISDSKKGAAKDSMYAYVKAVEIDTTKNMEPDVDLISGEFTTVDGHLYVGNIKSLDINLKGTKPSDREGSITLLNGQVVKAMLRFDGYDIGYDGNQASLATYKVGDIVYFDPTGVVTNCVLGKEWTPSNTGTTCYRWNVIKDLGTRIEVLLDHNTTWKVAWNSSGNNATGPKEVYNKLKVDTNSWSKTETLTSDDNIVKANASGSSYTINYVGMKARLISGQEIADIGKDRAWTPSNYVGTIYNDQSWIYQNLSNPGTNTKPWGYWLDTALLSYSNLSWTVSFVGNLNDYDIDIAEFYGVRPVVSILKSNL